MRSAAARRQFDLFLQSEDASGSKPADASPPRRRASRKSAPSRLIEDNEALAAHLESTGAYRILRRLETRPVLGSWSPTLLQPDEKIGIILDTETTGLDHRRHEIIELGMVMFTYTDDGIQDVVGLFDELREPGEPIAPEITRITGITDEMVAGRSIDPAAVADFIAPADLVIAHNARFDRPFCEAFASGFDLKAWACSNQEVDWRGFGFEGSKLSYLVGQCGFFHNGHRAVDDCHALLEVLSFEHQANGCAFPHLVASAAKRRCRIWAEHSPFDLKDALKARGYRWNDGNDGRPKSWWIEVAEEVYEEEIRFLRDEIYRRDCEPHVEWLTAVERFRS